MTMSIERPHHRERDERKGTHDFPSIMNDGQ